METFIKTKQKRNDPRAEFPEMNYVEENLLFFINKNMKTTRTNVEGRWVIKEDRETLLRKELLDFILGHFNMYELYVVFFSPLPHSYPCKNIYDTRSKAVDNVKRDDSFTPEEAKRLKRKIWNMHPIFFGLIVEFITSSGLFWDAHKKSVVYPSYKFVSHS
jgi:hypothetical protein